MLAKVSCAGQTDIGRRRENNQDQFLIAELHKSMLAQSSSLELAPESRLFGPAYARLFIVADGMGGHQAGNRASALAIEMLINQLVDSLYWLQPGDAERESRFMDQLKHMFTLAHRAIERESIAQAEHRGMGTTLTMAYVLWPTAYVVHAGDSRCYLVRNREIRQVTTDHTVSNQLVRQGGLKQEDAQSSPWSNVLFNALGAGGREVEAEVYKVGLQNEDVLILCSDGLYRHVADHEVRDLASQDLEPSACCQAMIDLTNQRGGIDNVTVIVARFIGSELVSDSTISDLARTSIYEKSKIVLQDTTDY